MWIVQPLEIIHDGKPSGKFRLTARSDEGGGGPFGLCEHAHDDAKAAAECLEAREKQAVATGIPNLIVVPYFAVYADAKSQVPMAEFAVEEWAQAWRDTHCATGIVKSEKRHLFGLSEQERLTVEAYARANRKPA